jgi:hypothetical protein
MVGWTQRAHKTANAYVIRADESGIHNYGEASGGIVPLPRRRNDAVSAAAVRVSERAEHYLCIKGRLSSGTNLIVPERRLTGVL